MERTTELILTALKQALAAGSEQRLYRSGKLPGLFAGKNGVNGDAAAQALRDGLLEPTHTETRGKTSIEWVKLTPKGVTFLHDQEAPVQVLRELRTALQVNRQGVPLWLADLRLELQTLEKQLTERAQRYSQWLDALERRVDEALNRLESARPNLPDTLAEAVPWAAEALAYLDKRSERGGLNGCPLPELFAAVQGADGDLSLPSFHNGLRRLADRRILHLVAGDPAQPLAEPEYALVEGDAVFYAARR